MEEKTLKSAVYFGLILGLSLLSKISTLLILLTIVFYAIILHLKKKYKERTLILISFFIGFLTGCYPLIRNYFLFGKLFFIDVYRIPENAVRLIIGLIRSYWGGIFGGLNGIEFFLGLFALIFMIMTFYGIFLYFKSKDFNLDFIILVGALNLLLGLNYICSFDLVVKKTIKKEK